MTKEETGMRMTTNRGRRHKNGAKFGAIHNDRQFDLDHAPHIDQTRTPDNHYWYWCQQDFPDLTFLQAEKKFYAENFQAALDAQNAKHIKSRHKERIKSMDDWYENQNMCPEEMIFQIGNKNTGQPTYEKIQTILTRFMQWSREKYPQVHFLTSGYHADEYSDHFQIRQVYVGHDKSGNPVPAQNQCLTEMGVPLPDPSKKESQYNNRKMTYSKICREKLFELGREMGLELIEEPREKGRSGRELDEVKTEGIRKDLEETQRQSQTAQKELKEVREEITEARMDLTALAFDQEQAERVLESTQDKIGQKEEELSEVQGQTEEAQRLSQATAQELGNLLNQLDGAKKAATFYKTPDGKAVHDFLIEYYPEILTEFYEEQDREHERNQKMVQESLEKLNNAPKAEPWTPSVKEKPEKKEKGQTLKDFWTFDPDMDF